MWIVLAVFLFYLFAIPVECAIKVNAQGVAIGFSRFESKIAFKSARPSSKKQRKRRAKPDIPLLIQAIWAFTAHLHPRKFTFTGTIGCSDAATTALICGAIQSFAQAIQPISPRIRIQVAPDFSQSAIQLAGILSVRAGHIILAALSGARIYLSGRFRAWINTRSRAS